MHSTSSYANFSTPPLDVALNTPLVVKTNTGLYRWLQSSNSMMAGGMISLGQILTLMKMIIAKAKLFDPRNPSIIECNRELESVFNMSYLHVKQVKEAILKSTILLSEYRRHRNHLDPQKNLPAIYSTNMPVIIPPAPAATPEQQTDLETDSGIGSDEDTDCQPPKSEIKDEVLPLYWVSEGLCNVLGLSGKPMTYQDISAKLSHYILARKEALFDNRNIMVAIVKNDPLGDVFKVRAFHRDQVSDFLNKNVQQVWREDVGEERELVIDIKKEVKEEELDANIINRRGFKRCATDCVASEGLPFKKRFLIQDHF